MIVPSTMSSARQAPRPHEDRGERARSDAERDEPQPARESGAGQKHALRPRRLPSADGFHQHDGVQVE